MFKANCCGRMQKQVEKGRFTIRDEKRYIKWDIPQKGLGSHVDNDNSPISEEIPINYCPFCGTNLL